jgi:hypothetical protein
MEPWRETPGMSLEAAQDELAAAGLTDGLPVIPPTRDRIERMLQGCGFDPDEMIAVLPPLNGEATWRNLTFNAVMAGCKADYLPVVGAAVEALAALEFNLLGLATTTGSAAPLIIVNGPVAAAIGMNAAANALGPGCRANAAIGRAVNLVLRNIGGAVPGEIDMATLGQPAKYACCFAENEAQTPWPPLHVERGFAANASVVTVVGIAGIVEVVDAVSNQPADLAQTFAQSMLIAGNVGSSGRIGGGEPLIILPPEHAAVFNHAGWSKQHVKTAIYERAVLPLARLSPAVQEHMSGLGHGSGAQAVLRVASQADDLMVVVAGGVGRKAAYVPTWSGGTTAVSCAVRSLQTGA